MWQLLSLVLLVYFPLLLKAACKLAARSSTSWIPWFPWDCVAPSVSNLLAKCLKHSFAFQAMNELLYCTCCWMIHHTLVKWHIVKGTNIVRRNLSGELNRKLHAKLSPLVTICCVRDNFYRVEYCLTRLWGELTGARHPKHDILKTQTEYKTALVNSSRYLFACSLHSDMAGIIKGYLKNLLAMKLDWFWLVLNNLLQDDGLKHLN